MTARHRAIVQMLLGATMISTSAVWVRAADVDPTAAGFWRMGLATVVLAGLAVVRGWNAWRNTLYFLRFLPVAAFFAIDLFLWHRAIGYVGPGLATILANLQVFIMAAVGTVFLGERLGWRFPAGLALVLPGLWLLVGVDAASLPAGYMAGVAMGIGTAFAYTGFLLGMRTAGRSASGLSAPIHLMYASGWCAVILAGLTVLGGESFAIPDVGSVGAMVAYGIVCQVIGWLFLTSAMPHLPASLVGLFLLLQPALAMVWDVLFFGRPTGLSDLGGLALVLVGIYLASVRRGRREPADQTSTQE